MDIVQHAGFLVVVGACRGIDILKILLFTGGDLLQLYTWKMSAYGNNIVGNFEDWGGARGGFEVGYHVKHWGLKSFMEVKFRANPKYQ